LKINIVNTINLKVDCITSSHASPAPFWNTGLTTDMGGVHECTFMTISRPHLQRKKSNLEMPKTKTLKVIPNMRIKDSKFKH